MNIPLNAMIYLFLAIIGMLTTASNVLGETHCADSEPQSPAVEDTQATVPSNPNPVCPTIRIEDIDQLDDSMRLVEARVSLATTDIRIPNALPLSVFPISTSQSNTAILVVGSGWDKATDLRVCAELQAKGYSGVKRLYGGIHAWIKSGRPIWGHSDMQQTLPSISPVQAHTAANRLDIGLAIFSTAGEPVNCPENRSTQVRCFTSVEDFLKTFEQWSEVEALALAGSDRDIAQTYRRIRSKNQLINVFTVTGGTKAMVDHFKHYQTLALASKQALSIPCNRR